MLWHLKNSDLSNAVSQSSRIQLALNSLIRTPVSLAEKHSKAKTGKLSPEFGTSRILKFCAFAKKNAVSLTNQGCKGCQNASPFCLTTLSIQDPSIENRHTVPEFGFAEFFSFCAFAEKNAVSLTNQGCKGGKSVGRDDRLWPPKLCAAKTKLCATKNRHNYLKFCAFAKKNAVSLTNQGCKIRYSFPESGTSRIPLFWLKTPALK